MVYFGTDPEAALALWLDSKDDLLAGRVTRVKADVTTVRDILNRFLTAKALMVESRELTERSFAEYKQTCALIGSTFGLSHPGDRLMNPHVRSRLSGVQGILKGVHQAGAPMSSATKGQERAAFIDQFLSQALPLPYRFGTGDATDLAGNQSGQLDVVVEYPHCPSLPLGVGESRLYLAESVAAVIEVKSDVAGQWQEALRTAEQLSTVKRSFTGGGLFSGGPPSSTIPLFVVGYTGWKTPETVREHLTNHPTISGILVIDPGIYVSRNTISTGPDALWAMVSNLYSAVSSILSTTTNPLRYLLDDVGPVG
jgi:hypothetical protein